MSFINIFNTSKLFTNEGKLVQINENIFVKTMSICREKKPLSTLIQRKLQMINENRKKLNRNPLENELTLQN